MSFDGFISLLEHLRSKTWLIAAVLAVDLVAMGYGWYYYWQVGQFNPASSFFVNPAWWVLVADSPNAVLLFFVASSWWLFGKRRNKWLDASAFLLNVYVGLWTTALFLLYPDRLGTWVWGSTNNILFATHLGMPLQALLLLPEMRKDSWTRGGLLLVISAAFLYVFVDYAGPHIHPAPFLHPADSLLHTVSPILMTITVAGTGLLIFRRRGRPKTLPQ